MGEHARMAPKAWIPHLVDGVSIWKDVRALNAPSLFDGRLLVPRPSKKHPGHMRWDVAGLLPLAEALEKFPTEVAAAVRDLHARTERVRADLADPTSPNHRLEEAFALPRMNDPKEARSYFFEPKSKQLRIANWGATRPPASYANEREDEEGPMSTIGATHELSALEATKEFEGDVATAAPMTKEQEAELMALTKQIEGELAETRDLLDVLDVLVTEGQLITPG